MPPQRPSWQLPTGVPRGVWEYAQARHVAQEYDADLAGHWLLRLDDDLLARRLARPGVVVDLGCGTGRSLLPLARRGLPGIAVDLSPRMLAIVREKAAAENLPIDCVQANLVELNCLADGIADYALCLFSTLGMIRGRANRRAVLAHAQRILRPGGLLVLHVHNLWHNLRDPGGPWWLLKSLLAPGMRRDFELGDKRYDYRGIPNFFLHAYRRRELLRDLHSASFRVNELIPLDAARGTTLSKPWLFASLRANGWIAVCRRNSSRQDAAAI